MPLPKIYQDRFWATVYILDNGLFRHRFNWSSDCRIEKDIPCIDAAALTAWSKGESYKSIHLSW